MASTNDLSAQAHLAAGMQKLEVLRGQFVVYLERKEQEVLMRMTTGHGSEIVDPLPPNLSEWLT